MIKELNGKFNNRILIKYASIIDIILYFIDIIKVNNISKLIILTWIFYNIENIKNIKKITIGEFQEIIKNTFKKCIISKAEDFNDILYCLDILKESNYIVLNQNNIISIKLEEYTILNKNLENMGSKHIKLINKLTQYDTIILLKELLYDNDK